jgi:hypothetical protein
MPVAVFAQPLYRLLHDTVRKWELIVLLLGVVVQWSYIGWFLDRGNAPLRARALRFVLAILGCVLGFLVLLESITMFHVGLLYKVAGVFCSFLIFRHFLFLLRISPAEP